jgi:hypothetical protein
MFADACQKAMAYTKPLVTNFVEMGGRANAGNGTMIIVNAEGWFLSAAHLFASFVKQQQDTPAVQAYAADSDRITKDASLTPKERKRQLGKLRRDDHWITGTSFWWTASLGEQPRPLDTAKFIIALDHDLVLGQLTNFDPQPAQEYPVFKCEPPLLPGTALCRLGFPFTTIQIDVDHASRSININMEGLQFFPNEGIFTRELERQPDAGGNVTRWIETSSPGLRGQSGGPIFDRHGTVWGVQSQTSHMSLGFDPPEPGNKNKTVHQFLNVGIGVHPGTIVSIMTQHGVNFRREGASS